LTREQNDISDPGVKRLLYNQQSIGQWLGREILHFPPSFSEHYPHIYKWDELFADLYLAGKGYAQKAAVSAHNFFQGQRSDGLLPNIQFMEKGRDGDLERQTFMDGSKSSDYGQPLIEAMAVNEIYEGLCSEGDETGAISFVQTMYPHLKASYDYYALDRRRGRHSPLIFNTHPHETGRDSDPTFDFFKIRLEGLSPEIVRAADYFSSIALGALHKLDRWQTHKIRHRFEVYDVMFNCIYADNLYEMAGLADKLASKSTGQQSLEYTADARRFYEQAQQVEQAILDEMWFAQEGENGVFLALRPEGSIKEVSVSNLFPLLLRNLDEEQLESLLDQLENCFSPPGIEFPIPSVPPINPLTMKPNPKFDPHHKERDRLWRGSTWINMNWYLVERGLDVQASRIDLAHRPDLIARYQDWVQIISERSYKIVAGVGEWEYYNPINSRPQRTNRTPGFSWSVLAYRLKDKYLKGLV